MHIPDKKFDNDTKPSTSSSVTDKCILKSKNQRQKKEFCWSDYYYYFFFYL